MLMSFYIIVAFDVIICDTVKRSDKYRQEKQYEVVQEIYRSRWCNRWTEKQEGWRKYLSGRKKTQQCLFRKSTTELIDKTAAPHCSNYCKMPSLQEAPEQIWQNTKPMFQFPETQQGFYWCYKPETLISLMMLHHWRPSNQEHSKSDATGKQKPWGCCIRARRQHHASSVHWGAETKRHKAEASVSFHCELRRWVSNITSLSGYVLPVLQLVFVCFWAHGWRNPMFRSPVIQPVGQSDQGGLEAAG